jgi:hypothetical protein
MLKIAVKLYRQVQRRRSLGPTGEEGETESGPGH